MFDYKILFGIAAMIASIGFTIQSIVPADALMTSSVSYGSNPYKAFYGTTQQGTTSLLTTNTETFIITGVTSDDGDDLSVVIDGVTVIPATSLDEKDTYHSPQNSTYDSYNWAYARSNLFLNGNATLPVEPGETLQVNCSNNSGCFYYIQGYYVH